MIESLYFAPVNMAPELRCGQELPLPILLASLSPESVCRVTTKYLSGIEFLYLSPHSLPRSGFNHVSPGQGDI